ncbi:carbohydrate kinase family protein [Pseudosulfitobacter koreensis]|uniref:Carbohydrate kinase n=1 Tax=Pseudosulfitobacter koreensis TaxID=2968472 RepID=A0ABT1Z3Y0_9RHOB|nr:carbohydrate kinase [Pseudosulfitobacter koreense]MCR8827820.1 carbohydrate kinase [Pseudosulfitobacter koreense]
MPTTAKIAIGGENLIDFVQTGEEDGAPLFDANPGGSPFNVAVGLARQEVQTHYVTPISTDALGDTLAERLTASGATVAAPRSAAPTSRAVVTLEQGIPAYAFHRDGTAERQVTESSLWDSIPADVSALHCGGLALVDGVDADAWTAVLVQAATRGIFISFDPNVRASLIHDPAAYTKRVERVLQVAHLVKLSDEDLRWLYPDRPEAEAVAALRAATSAGLVVLTRGPLDTSAYARAAQSTVPVPKVTRLVDTVGAGDTFMATLLAALADRSALSAEVLDGMDQSDLTALLTRAGQAAALNCERSGCNPPSRSELDAALAG